MLTRKLHKGIDISLHDLFAEIDSDRLLAEKAIKTSVLGMKIRFFIIDCAPERLGQDLFHHILRCTVNITLVQAVLPPVLDYDFVSA